jgi:hypothetical protein
MTAHEAIADMTRNESATLLLLERCAVSRMGGVVVRELTDKERTAIQQLVDRELIVFGLIAPEHLPLPSGSTHWVELTDKGWDRVSELRQYRAMCGKAERTWHPAPLSV